MWIGTDESLFRLRDGQFTQWTDTSGLPRGPVRAILPRPDGTVWVATYGGGLGLLKNGRFSRVPGLPDHGLSALVADKQNRLWILSNRGLLVADLTHLADVAEGRAASLDVTVIGTEAGVPEGNHGAPAGWADPSGRLWFATIFDVIAVDPAAFPFNREPPVATIDSVAADSTLLDLTGSLAIPARTSRVTFAFTSYALTAPERIMFRWRLDGVDASWSLPTTRRTRLIHTTVAGQLPHAGRRTQRRRRVEHPGVRVLVHGCAGLARDLVVSRTRPRPGRGVAGDHPRIPDSARARTEPRVVH